MTPLRSITSMITTAGAATVFLLVMTAAPLTAAPGTQSAADEAMLYPPAAPTSSASAISQDTLSEAEIADILFMREEEKLANDVYVTLGQLWGTPIFSNIARAETSHMDAIGTLIDRYGLNDPIDDNPVGVFLDPSLQAMYHDLVSTGSQSPIDALEVGALVEEVDIADLIDSIEETKATDVALVWQQLLSGSQNHLRAFTSQLDTQSIDYEPTVLDPETYDQMLSEAGQGNGGIDHDRGVPEGRQGRHGNGRNS